MAIRLKYKKDLNKYLGFGAERACYYLRRGVIENIINRPQETYTEEEIEAWAKESKRLIKNYKIKAALIQRNKLLAGSKRGRIKRDWPLPKPLQDLENALKKANWDPLRLPS